jgi:hypothetical protein
MRENPQPEFGGLRRGWGYDTVGGSRLLIYLLEVLERELLLAGVEDVPEVLHPHRRRCSWRSPEPEKTRSP